MSKQCVNGRGGCHPRKEVEEEKDDTTMKILRKARNPLKQAMNLVKQKWRRRFSTSSFLLYPPTNKRFCKKNFTFNFQIGDRFCEIYDFYGFEKDSSTSCR